MAIGYSKEQFKFALKNTYNIPEFLFKENIFCKIFVDDVSTDGTR